MGMMRATSKHFRIGLMWLGLLCATGCGRGCKSGFSPIHLIPDMDNQPKARAQSQSDFFYNGSTMQMPVPNTIARGELFEDVVYYTGKDAEGNFVKTMPVEITDAVLERGRQRFNIYCAPCHTERGNGEGILFTRGGVPTTSVYDPRLLEIEDGHIYDVITNGLGFMAGYKYPIPTDDRWAIVAHVRTLQDKYGEPEPAEEVATAEATP